MIDMRTNTIKLKVSKIAAVIAAMMFLVVTLTGCPLGLHTPGSLVVCYRENTLTWDHVQGAEYYRIYEDTRHRGSSRTAGGELYRAPETSWRVIATVDTNRFCIEDFDDIRLAVRAIGDNGFNSQRSFTVEINRFRPLRMPRLIIKDNGVLTWPGVSGSNGYRVGILQGELGINVQKVVTDRRVDLMATTEAWSVWMDGGRGMVSVTALGHGVRNQEGLIITDSASRSVIFPSTGQYITVNTPILSLESYRYLRWTGIHGESIVQVFVNGEYLTSLSGRHSGLDILEHISIGNILESEQSFYIRAVIDSGAVFAYSNISNTVSIG